MCRASLKKSQDFDQRWAKFSGQPVGADSFNHQHPGPPTCVQECSANNPFARDPADLENARLADQLANGLTNSLTQEFSRIASTYGRSDLQTGNPFRASGQVMNDYVNALRMARDSVLKLRSLLYRTDLIGLGLAADIERAMRDARGADSRIQTAYSALPVAVREAMAGRVPTPAAPPPPSAPTTVAPVAAGRDRADIPVPSFSDYTAPLVWAFGSGNGKDADEIHGQQSLTIDRSQLVLRSQDFRPNREVPENATVECVVALSAIDPAGITARTIHTEPYEVWGVDISLQGPSPCVASNGNERLQRYHAWSGVWIYAPGAGGATAQNLANQIRAAVEEMKRPAPVAVPAPQPAPPPTPAPPPAPRPPVAPRPAPLSTSRASVPAGPSPSTVSSQVSSALDMLNGNAKAPPPASAPVVGPPQPPANGAGAQVNSALDLLGSPHGTPSPPAARANTKGNSAPDSPGGSPPAVTSKPPAAVVPGPGPESSLPEIMRWIQSTVQANSASYWSRGGAPIPPGQSTVGAWHYHQSYRVEVDGCRLTWHDQSVSAESTREREYSINLALAESVIPNNWALRPFVAIEGPVRITATGGFDAARRGFLELSGNAGLIDAVAAALQQAVGICRKERPIP